MKNSKRRCEPCKANRREKDTKTTAVCDLCLVPTCANHYVRVCEKCYMIKFKGPESECDDDGSYESDVGDAEAPSTSKPPQAKRLRVDSVINL